jgi:hypothetical protein
VEAAEEHIRLCLLEVKPQSNGGFKTAILVTFFCPSGQAFGSPPENQSSALLIQLLQTASPQGLSIEALL